MSDIDVLPELKQIIGALLFGAKTPLSAGDIRRVLQQVAESWGGKTRDFAKATEADIRAALEQLRADFVEKKVGLHVSEVANGFRLENDVACGPWLRHLLARGRPQRLSRPALETLAIIAYRQPCMRSEIESVRGVAVDQIIRNLLEMQLIRIVGRSELPGRPWQFGTTQRFLEHFGLKSVQDLPGIEELRRMEAEQLRNKDAASPSEEKTLADEEPTGEAGAESEKEQPEPSEEPVAEDEPSEKAEEPAEELDDERLDLAEELGDEEEDEEEYDDEDDEDDEDEDEDEDEKDGD